MHKMLLAVSFALIAVVMMTVVVAQDEPMTDHAFFESDEVLVMAHRGGMALRPENTMAAFEHAVEIGVDVLEIDVYATSDDVIVTIHDSTVDRTTDGEGAVLDFTFEELQALDAGHNFEDENGEFPYRGQGVTIPALEEIFQAFPDMLMNIEIKQREPSIVEDFCDLLNEYDMGDNVLIASFHEETIVEFRETCPGIPTSSVESEIQRFVLANALGNTDNYEPVSSAFQVPEFFGDLHVVTEEFVTGAQSLGIDVHVWTVNEEEQMQRMIDLGVDGIITDYPNVLLELLGRGE